MRVIEQFTKIVTPLDYLSQADVSRIGDSKLKIGIVPGDLRGQFYHHFFVPAKYSKEIKYFVILGSDSWKKLEWMDMVIFHRQYHMITNLIARKLKDKVRLHFIDDLIFELHEKSPAYSAYQGLNLYRFKVLTWDCDGVLATTKYTRDYVLNEKLTLRAWNVSNILDPEIIEIGKKAKKTISSLTKSKEIRIGWTTTPHHIIDWVIIEPVVKTLGKDKNFRFVFFGWIPEALLKEQIMIEYYAPVEVEKYYQSLAYLGFDIGIAPLSYHKFNNGKTPLKLQEYAFLNIPSIASPVSAYEEWKSEIHCLKPQQNKYMEWINSIKKMCDKNYRQEIADRAFTYANETCNAEIRGPERDKLLISIYEECNKSKR